MNLGAKVGAFVDGAANFLTAMGVSSAFAVALMGVLVASFAGTTLDTACRLQRYVVQELSATFLASHDRDQEALFSASRTDVTGNPLSWLANKHGATIFAVFIAAALAALPKPGVPWDIKSAGTGGLILWPLFGATNQLLGGLSFLVVGFYLWRRSKPIYFLALPLVFMLVMPAWAMLMSLPNWINPSQGDPNWVVVNIAIATLVLEGWMIVEALALWPRVKGVLEPQLPTLMTCPATGN
jgi:carbon starvation protein